MPATAHGANDCSASCVRSEVSPEILDVLHAVETNSIGPLANLKFLGLRSAYLKRHLNHPDRKLKQHAGTL